MLRSPPWASLSILVVRTRQSEPSTRVPLFASSVANIFKPMPGRSGIVRGHDDDNNAFGQFGRDEVPEIGHCRTFPVLQVKDSSAVLGIIRTVATFGFVPGPWLVRAERRDTAFPKLGGI